MERRDDVCVVFPSVRFINVPQLVLSNPADTRPELKDHLFSLIFFPSGLKTRSSGDLYPFVLGTINNSFICHFQS